MTSNGDFYSKSTKKSQKSHTNQPISIKQEKKTISNRDIHSKSTNNSQKSRHAKIIQIEQKNTKISTNKNQLRRSLKNEQNEAEQKL
jgi:hypothetical protein